MTPYQKRKQSAESMKTAPITLKTDSMETLIENTAAPSVEVPRLVRLSCDGRCGQYGTCKGDVRQVIVKSGDGRRTWGRYSYCESAISEDVTNGYIVKPNDKLCHGVAERKQ